MTTTVFAWWKKRGKSLAELAQALNYSPDYLYHLSSGDYPITEGFKARCVLHLGDEARFLFFGNDDSPELPLRQIASATESPQAPPDAP